MTARSWASLVRYVGVGALSAALLATPALVGSPAEALPAPGPSAPRSAEEVPTARRIPDTAPVTSRVLERVRRDVAAAREAGLTGSTARTSADLPLYRVKVQIHIIHGTHSGERKVKRKGARRLFRIMRYAYAGAQWPGVSEPMGVVFDLKRITIHRNDRWYHARPRSRADKQMKRKLHRGTAQTLNIYINAPRFPGGGGVLLGFATFPWNAAARPKLDGVTVNVAALPGGRATGYNLGDTAVHETGHWLGLLHTFHSASGHGCDPYNDGVSDTPMEQGPNFSCTNMANLCDPTEVAVEGKKDPAYNFMEYTLDACMRMFTEGQHQRAAQMYATYRYGR